MKRLYAISDLHLERTVNLEALAALPAHPDDWLILAGDVAEVESYFRLGLDLLRQKFEQVFWVPGNHELWSLPADTIQLQGQERYYHLVDICRQYGVLTPEDPYVRWPDNPSFIIAPTFTLYDYTFCPEGLSEAEALAWAAESGIVCTDEYFLKFDPFQTRSQWCQSRCHYTEQRLEAASQDGSIILINHFPLRSDHAVLPRVPRFSIWCGTRNTESWHTRFKVAVVVYGHLHIRKTRYLDGVRFEEVSLGYPRQWHPTQGLLPYLREILPNRHAFNIAATTQS